jgi:hypothetical protein
LSGSGREWTSLVLTRVKIALDLQREDRAAAAVFQCFGGVPQAFAAVLELFND